MFDARDIPPVFEEVREKDERFLWVDRPERVPFVASGVPFLIIGIAWGTFDLIILHSVKRIEPGAVAFFAFHMLPLWLSIYYIIHLALVSGNTYYGLTPQRLLFRTGLRGSVLKSIELGQIANLEVNVSPIENSYGVGSIRVSSYATDRKGRRMYAMYQTIIAVHEPYEVFRRLKESISAATANPNKRTVAGADLMRRRFTA